MSTFNTKRTPSTDEMLQKLVEQKRIRENSRAALLENHKAQEVAKNEKAILENQDIHQAREATLLESQNNLMNHHKKQVRNQKLALLESRLIEEGMASTMEAVLFDYVIESSWIDNMDHMSKSEYDTALESYREIVEIVESVATKQKPSKLMESVEKMVRKVVTERAKAIVDNIREDCDDLDGSDIDGISFALNDEDLSGLDQDLTDLGKEQLVSMVKSKVLSVVQDEKEASAKKAELIAELDQAEQDLEDKKAAEVKGDEPMGDEPKEGEDTSDKETGTQESCIESMILRNKRLKFNKANGSTLFDAIFMENVSTISNMAVTEGIDVTNRKDLMDAAYRTTIFNYTVLETLNTLGIYDLSNISTARALRDKFKSFCK